MISLQVNKLKLNPDMMEVILVCGGSDLGFKLSAFPDEDALLLDE